MITEKWENNQDDWIYVRTKVYIEEQGFVHEFDDKEDIAQHLTIYKDGQLIGCARGYIDADGLGLVQRITVLKAFRNQGFGKYLVKRMEDKLRSMNAEGFKLHAQQEKVSFYERLGYQAFGKADFEEFMPHQWMKKGDESV